MPKSEFGLKKQLPGFQAGPGYQVTPDEIDRYEVYHILKPGIGTAAVATAAGTAAAPTVGIIASTPDYPRNLTFSPSGTPGTVVVTGVDQFGASITETISAAADATGVGTLVFGSVTSAVVSKATGAGTCDLGYASGTSSTSPLFGLPFKIGGTADVKRALWIDNGTSKFLGVNDSAPHVVANTATHSVRIEVSGGVAAADDFIIWAKPTYDASGDTKPQAGI